MNTELRKFYSGKEHTSQVILDGNGFNPEQLSAMLKSYVLNHWNGQQVNDDGKIQSSEIKILDYAYQMAKPKKCIVTIQWRFV